MVILTLPPDPASVARARRYVSEALAAAGIDSATREPAVLLTSELVTNGIIHGGSHVDVRLDLAQDALRVEVVDSGCGCPVAEAVAPDAEHGRGLMIVSGLASRWGVELGSSRTAVWFELSCPRSPTRRERPRLLDAVVGPVRRFVRRIPRL
jgi:anti-sigma regulatory factor (Ser/Thr protein kinase)